VFFRSRRLGAVATGLGLVAAALSTFLLLTPQFTYHTDIVPAMVLLGAGGTIVMVIGSDPATRNTGKLSGTASSLVNATQQLGAAIGTTPLTSIALLAPRQLGHGQSSLTAEATVASLYSTGTQRQEKPSGLQAVLARTRTVHRPIGPVAYDCVKVIVVRDGSAILFSEFGQKPVKVGDVILLGANTLCGSEPEGRITITTVYLDTDYVVDQVFWQHAGLLRDRLDAQDFAETKDAWGERSGAPQGLRCCD
jgi:hypothetical protein